MSGEGLAAEVLRLTAVARVALENEEGDGDVLDSLITRLDALATGTRPDPETTDYLTPYE